MKIKFMKAFLSTFLLKKTARTHCECLSNKTSTLRVICKAVVMQRNKIKMMKNRSMRDVFLIEGTYLSPLDYRKITIKFLSIIAKY